MPTPERQAEILKLQIDILTQLKLKLASMDYLVKALEKLEEEKKS